MNVKGYLLSCKKIWEYYLKIEADALEVTEELKKDKNTDTYKEGDFKKITIPHLRLLYKWKHKNPIPPGSNKHFLFAA